MNMKKAIVISVITLIVIIVVAAFFAAVIGAGHILNVKITKKLIVDIIYEPVSVQDALLSLMEMKDSNGITFKRALVYALYEDTLKPKVPKSGCADDLCDYDLKAVAKKYIDYVYKGKKYWLFLYGPDIKTLAKNSEDKDFNKVPYGMRDSIPVLPGKYWLVLYVA